MGIDKEQAVIKILNEIYENVETKLHSSNKEVQNIKRKSNGNLKLNNKAK